jgi:tetratricopeptide (TPR) repeat protein
MRNKLLVLAAAIAALMLGAASTGCKKLAARDNLNKGVAAFKNAKYADAVEFFKQSIENDPDYTIARLYLATAYMSQYIPGALSPENVSYAKSAEEHFRKVLEANSKDTTALKSLASLAFQMAGGEQDPAAKIRRFDESAEWYKKLIAADPNEKEAFYSLGVISWSKFYPAWMAARQKLGMKPEAPGPIKDKKVREELRAQYEAIVADGIKNLEQSLKVDKEYDDAMAYLNLLHRERADFMESEGEYKTETDLADNYMTKALETRKIKAERQPKAAGVVQDTGAGK